MFPPLLAMDNDESEFLDASMDFDYSMEFDEVFKIDACAQTRS
jgi:hypothetical protein